MQLLRPWLIPLTLLALAGCAHAPIPLSSLDSTLKPDLTANQCVAQFGTPMHDFGAGEPIYQYPVAEGGSVMLSFSPTLQSAVYAPPNRATQQLFPK